MKKQKKIVAIVLILILAAAGIFVWRHFDSKTSTQGANTGADKGINYSPPTKEEQESGDKVKDQVIKTQDQDSKPQTTPANATVMITDAAQYGDTVEVRSFISNIYKDGTCTIAFTQGSLNVTKEAPAYQDATTTICTNPVIKRSEFPAAGNWQLTVSYKSTDGTASGTSAIKTVTLK